MAEIPARVVRPADDFYETPAHATRALLAVERFAGRLWEPCAGGGAIARVLRAAGHEVFASTLHDDAEGVFGGWDFLTIERLPTACGAIVTNPPFNRAGEMVRHALALNPPKVVMLLNIKFLGSIGRARGLFAETPPARVHIIADRITMYPKGYEGPKGTTTETHGWFVWDGSHVGAPTVSWVVAGDYLGGAE